MAVHANILTSVKYDLITTTHVSFLFCSLHHDTLVCLAVYSASEYPLYLHLGPAAFLRRNIFFRGIGLGTKTLTGGTIARFWDKYTMHSSLYILLWYDY